MTPIARSSRGSASAWAASPLTQVEDEARLPDLVEERLEALGQRRPHPLALGRRVPGRGGGHRPRVGGEADQDDVVGPALAGELADVELAAAAHLGHPRVADVGVVLPDDDPRPLAVAAQVLAEALERVGHVAVAQVPGGGRVAEHRAVVLLGAGDEARVLLGVELLVLGGDAVAAQVGVAEPLQARSAGRRPPGGRTR